MVVKWCIMVAKWSKYFGGLSMFLGISQHSLDEKNRLILPKKDRDDFNGNAIISYDFDGNLVLFTTSSFEARANKVNSQSDFDENARKLKRITFGLSQEVTIDNQGRILLPSFLLVKANIKKNVILVGDFDRIEIWDEDTYHAKQEKDENDYSWLAQEMVKNEK